MAAMAQPRYTLEDPAYEPRTARDAREAARAARNGQSPRYRRTQSPEQLDDFRPQSEEFDMRSPTSDVALQDAIVAQAQQHQQRVVPVGQVTRNAGQRRQPPGPNNNAPRGPHPGPGPQQPMPPTYPGGMDGGPQQQQPNGPRDGGRYRRQSRRGSESEPRPHGESPPRNGPNTQQSRVSQSMASDQHQQRRAPSPDRLAVPGNDINRLNSPSIQKSVLLPLEQKIHEYDLLMNDAQAQMNQLDDEIRALQERRRQAEDRFIEAKSKHDDYSRQHDQVGKALRGELMQQPPPPAVRQPVQRMESIDSFEHRPVSVQSSFNQKPKKGGLRMSLFNRSN
ncbi:uncharacterized protein FMAN_14902 [Fusarium mangiferae]|uniref:Uncharacterized protein n=1 Tax=Fusarium mangiferae TaxID=192010 RepID=A0A1L7U0X7_FUSMA|nr:uncharacterized protein FMAN_14902 [Fusarium mangiferae]CVL03969.1 uncharacterized protein FMAN_14902 [Fusarium mangiferae]